MWSALDPTAPPPAANPAAAANSDVHPSLDPASDGRGGVVATAAGSHPPPQPPVVLPGSLTVDLAPVDQNASTAAPETSHDQRSHDTAVPSQPDPASKPDAPLRTAAVAPQAGPLTSFGARELGNSGKRKAPETPMGGDNDVSGAARGPGDIGESPAGVVRPAGADSSAAEPVHASVGAVGGGPSSVASHGLAGNAGGGVGAAQARTSLWGGESSDDSEELPDIDSGPSSDEESDDD
jgi:hypothetical protein